MNSAHGPVRPQSQKMNCYFSDKLFIKPCSTLEGLTYLNTQGMDERMKEWVPKAQDALEHVVACAFDMQTKDGKSSWSVLLDMEENNDVK